MFPIASFPPSASRHLIVNYVRVYHLLIIDPLDFFALLGRLYYAVCFQFGRNSRSFSRSLRVSFHLPIRYFSVFPPGVLTFVIFFYFTNAPWGCSVFDIELYMSSCSDSLLRTSSVPLMRLSICFDLSGPDFATLKVFVGLWPSFVFAALQF